MPTYTTPGPVNVRIDLPLGDTRIIASDRDTTVVDVLGEDGAIRCELSGNQLTVSTTADRGGPLGWGLGMLGLGPGSGATVTVEVPTGSDLHATTRHGSLSTEGRLGTCQVHTEYGDVHLDEVGVVEIRSRHADISVERATADLEITTSSGDVRVGVVEGSASITDNDSDITLTEARGPLQLRGSHGDMAIDRLCADLLARNAYGSVRVTEVVEGTLRHRHHLRRGRDRHRRGHRGVARRPVRHGDGPQPPRPATRARRVRPHGRGPRPHPRRRRPDPPRPTHAATTQPIQEGMTPHPPINAPGSPRPRARHRRRPGNPPFGRAPAAMGDPEVLVARGATA